MKTTKAQDEGEYAEVAEKSKVPADEEEWDADWKTYRDSQRDEDSKIFMETYKGKKMKSENLM